MKKIKIFDSSYFCGKSHFEEDGTQNYFIFQPIHRYSKTVSSKSDNILSWKFKGLSDRSIKAPTKSNKLLNPSLDYVGSRIKVNFNGDCLKQERLDFSHRNIVKICIVYEINKSVNISSYPTLKSCLFGAIKLTKHVDIDPYKYSRYGIGFGRKGFFRLVII